jgi:hypothetical protein
LKTHQNRGKTKEREKAQRTGLTGAHRLRSARMRASSRARFPYCL